MPRNPFPYPICGDCGSLVHPEMAAARPVPSLWAELYQSLSHTARHAYQDASEIGREGRRSGRGSAPNNVGIDVAVLAHAKLGALGGCRTATPPFGPLWDQPLCWTWWIGRTWWSGGPICCHAAVVLRVLAPVQVI